jgi:hypothetical protein
LAQPSLFIEVILTFTNLNTKKGKFRFMSGKRHKTRIFPMYKVLDKDIINKEIVPNLPVPKRGFKTKSDMGDIVNCILYKLKSATMAQVFEKSRIFLYEK